jgi:ABC-2 type transport system ATP-binding protein
VARHPTHKYRRNHFHQCSDRHRQLPALFELGGEPSKLIDDYSKACEGVDAVGARIMKEILLDQVRRGAIMFLTSQVLEGAATS